MSVNRIGDVGDMMDNIQNWGLNVMGRLVMSMIWIDYTYR